MNPFEETLCRACLHVLAEDLLEEDTKHNLFSTPDLLQKFQACTGLNAESKDELPKNLCDDCFQKVNKLHTFRMMCIAAVPTFHEMLQTQQTNRVEDFTVELLCDDEKPIFDLNAQMKLEITVEEQQPVLLQSKNPSIDAVTTAGEVKCDKKINRRQRGQTAKRKSQNTAAVERKLKAIKRKHSKESRSLDETEEARLEKKDAPSDQGESDEEAIAFTENKDGETDKEFLLSSLNKRESTAKSVKHNAAVTKSECQKEPIKKSTSNKSIVYQCSLCPLRFFAKQRLIAHERNHKGLDPYACPRDDCDKTFKSCRWLSEHLKKHEGINTLYPCEEVGCNKVYKHKPTLAMHMRKSHKQGAEILSPVCEICGKVFKSTTILNDHRYTHKDKSELPHACDHPGCTRRFSRPTKLRMHKMRHDGIRNFACSYCGLQKTTRTELKLHMNYHTLERTFSCRFCSLVTNTAANLKIHVRTIHEGAKDYACGYCERTFATPYTKKYHEMTHTGEKPHKCKECGKCFTQPTALRTHQKMHIRQKGEVTTTASSTSDTIKDT